MENPVLGPTGPSMYPDVLSSCSSKCAIEDLLQQQIHDSSLTTVRFMSQKGELNSKGSLRNCKIGIRI